MSEVKVTVICLTYNHEAWIREALEGFVEQDVPWPVEVLVHDDASTDGTAAIVREYESRYPELIYGFYAKENRSSRGIIISRDILMPYIRGEYVALCEGDDYWTDSGKLRRQVEALEANPNADICAHAAKRMRPDGNVWNDAPRDRGCIIGAEDVILGGGGFVATGSLMVRASRYKEIPPFREVLFNDYSLQIWGSLRGGMVYLDEFMSVYRQGLPGSWTEQHHGEAHIEYRVLIRNMLRALDTYTEGRYSEVIEKRIKLYDSDDLAARGKVLNMLTPDQLPTTWQQIRRGIKWLGAQFRRRK